jgi:isoleucyl-tRNA synthetase
VISAINDVAEYLPDFGFLRGKNAKKHPELILNYLKEQESQGERWIFQIKPYKHRYPVCWRCKTELVWKVSDVWYIGMDREEICKSANGKSTNRKTLREQMVETAKMIDWHPSFGLERELDWLSNMHDWLISKKNRYWGLALPIYECSHCGSFEVVGSYEELKTKAVSGWEKFEGKTPHKPFIDEVQIACPSCKKPMKRIDDVGNVWLDAGIVPFSTYVDPTTKKLSYTTDKKYWKEWFPPDFITESFPGQFKNWFYSMIAMSTVLEKRNPFQTVLGYASMLGEDGRPMHKSLGNAIEFNQGADAIGADVMRWLFCLSDPEQNILFGYKKADETRRKFHLMLWNVYNFFVTYANADGWKPIEQKNKPTHVLDRWILSRLNFVIEGVTGELSEYKPHVATALLEEFLTDLSQWYVRRSRNRVGPTAQDVNDKNICYETLYNVLTTLMRLLAPFIPYMTEAIYKNLTKELSVHLSDWPEANVPLKDISLENDMMYARQIVEKIHAKRKELKIPVRQPLGKCQMSDVHAYAEASAGKQFQISAELIELIKEETNIKTIILNKGEGEIEVELDTAITPELEKEGKVREVIRTIQQLRKEKKCAIDEPITLTLPSALQTLGDSYLESIKQETLSDKILWGDSFSISTYR